MSMVRKQLTAPARNPILVTGVPRSGTTWMARTLASAPGTALAGREPMNPRGRQYGLGNTLHEWVRLENPSPRQTKLIRSAYRGTNPMVLSRYGKRQWSAPLPWTRMIVKDPFAMLSIPAIISITNARPILIYRHPGAVLSSFRRMGWTANLEEIRTVIPVNRHGAREINHSDSGADDVSNTAHFWASLNRQALADLAHVDGALVVSHEEIATGGDTALKQLFDLCALPWKARPQDRTKALPSTAAQSMDPSALHNLNRPSAQVAESWRKDVSKAEISVLESIAGQTLDDLKSSRVALG